MEESPARFGQERAQLVHLAVFLALDHGAMGVEAWADRCKGKTWCQCSIPPATPRTSHLGLLHLIFHHPNRFKTLLDSILHILASYVTYMVPRQKGTVGTPWEHRGGLSETARGDRLETVLREKLHSAQLPEPDLVQYPVCPRPLGRTGDEGI